MKLPFFNKFKKQTTESVGMTTIDDASRMLSGNTSRYSALENSAFWACIQELVGYYSSLPWKLYKDSDKFPTEIHGDHPIIALMKHPAPYLNGVEWRAIMGLNYELFSEAFAIIDRRGGTIVALYPVSPNLMMPNWVDNNTRLTWRYIGTGSHCNEIYEDDAVLRFTKLPCGYDSVLSLDRFARKDMDIVKKSKELQESYYKNGASVGGIMTVPKGTSQNIKDQLSAMLRGNYTGAVNAQKTMIIEDSMKYEALHLQEGDITRLKEAQSWAKDEVYARFFGIDTSSSQSYSNVEQAGIYKVRSILPRFVAWETAFDELLPDGYFNKFNLKGLMRADITTQMNSIVSGVNNGLYTINEGRRLLDYAPIEGGDIIRVPLNYGILRPDGTIENPNATTSQSMDPFALAFGAEPTTSSNKNESLDHKTKDALSEAELKEEKKKQDLLFLEKTTNVTKSNRSKIEALMRKQVNDLITKANEDIAAGTPYTQVKANLEAYAAENAKTYGSEYAEVFKDVMNRLLPIIQKQVETDKPVSQDDMDAYSYKFGDMMSSRFSTDRVNEFAKVTDEETWNDLQDRWYDKPTEVAGDETHRAGNAFQLFLYGKLGLEYLHVVASADACEFCQGLDGKTVEVNGNILTKGTTSKDGAGNVRRINKSYKHPPFHQYCTCGIAPGKGF